MTRIMLAPVLALGAVLAGSGFAPAAEPANPLTGFTMTLGGKGTAAEAATAKDDTEETWCCRRRCYGGYGYGNYYGGGYGYSSYYGGGYGYGNGGYYGGGNGYSNYYSYRPAYYYNSYAYRPHYYRPYVNYYGGYGYRGGFGGGVYVGINGAKDDAETPVMSLALASAGGSSFRYDGGPANPVPQVQPDANPQTKTAPAAVGLPVSLKKETASPYRYKAYGEK